MKRRYGVMGSLSYALGIDLGGTFIKSAVVSSEGKIFEEEKIPSLAERGPKKVLEQIEKAISITRTRKPLSGIGIGAPGIVTNGVVRFPPNFRNWKVVDLRKIIREKHRRIKIEADNDAKCAGLAELRFGYGKKYSNFLHLTLGTGIGGAIIIDGKIYRGETFGAGEFGMMSINFNGPPCLGGNPGAVESYIGRNYFLENERAAIRKLGLRHKAVDFTDITFQADKNNKTAKSLYRRYGFYLGVGLANYFNLMDVRTCILSGGIANAYKYFIDECKKTIRERALPTIRNEFRVLRSKVANRAGVLGAASLIFEEG